MELHLVGSGRFEQVWNVRRPGRHTVATVTRVSFPIGKEAITVKQLLLVEYLLVCRVLSIDYFSSLQQLCS